MVSRSKTEKQIIKELKAKGYTPIHSHKIGRKVYDIYIAELNMLIEFNGDYWHCNPKKYNANYFNARRNMTAKDIWDRDAEKEKLAIKSGYNFLTIWELDYKKNKKIIFSKIIQKNGRKVIKHVRSRFTNR